MLESVALSSLTPKLTLRCLDGLRRSKWILYKALEIHMKNGEIIDRRGCPEGISMGVRLDALLDFSMPLDLEQTAYIRLCGEDVYLE